MYLLKKFERDRHGLLEPLVEGRIGEGGRQPVSHHVGLSAPLPIHLSTEGFNYFYKVEKPNYYAVIPACVRYGWCSAGAKLLYGEIAALSDKKGFCWASNTYFAELYNVNDRTVSRWVTELEKDEHIKVSVVNGGRQICLGGVDKNVGGGTTKMSSIIRGKASENGSVEAPKVMQPSANNTVNTTYNGTLVPKTRVALQKKKSNFGYSENNPPDDLPSIDSDTGEVQTEIQASSAKQSMKELMDWAVKRRGGPFSSVPKQLKAMKILKDRLNVSPDDVMNRWAEMEEDRFYKERGFDFMDVVSSFNRKPLK